MHVYGPGYSEVDILAQDWDADRFERYAEFAEWVMKQRLGR